MSDTVEFPDFYRILEIDSSASLAAIKQKYHQLSLKHHPDKQQGQTPAKDCEKEFVTLNLAYKVLSNPELKHEYDVQYAARASNSVPIHDQISLDEMELQDSSYRIPCRCGGVFQLSKEAADLPLPSVCVNCDTCSLCISVQLQT